MGTEEIARRGEVGGAQPVQPCLPIGLEPKREDQRRRWIELTRVTLPAMAAAARWPIRLDHCFMRVLLDNVFGGVWHHIIRKPAIANISSSRLEAAIALGERVVAEPGLLPDLNRRSLSWRGKKTDTLPR